jgi:general secretion pathway protein A
MFTNCFQMNAHPFSENPPLDHLLKDQRFTQALAKLDYFTHEGSLALVTAATGLGKTSLLRLFARKLNPTQFMPVYIHMSNLKGTSLLKIILASLGEDVPARGKERLFLGIIERARLSEQTLLFLIDEAHLISPDGLTDLRLLVSSAFHDQPLLKIVLAGQDHLLQTIKRPQLLDLLHRICVKVHLRHLTDQETLLYIDFKLKAVNASKDVFDKDAKTLIHDYSGGAPRLINKLATNCLLLAASQGLQKITEDLVHQASADLKLP